MGKRDSGKRPSDEPIYTSPYGMDFEKRQLIVPPGSVTFVFGDQMRQTGKTTSFTASNETVILVDATDSSVTITLPAASTKTNKWYWVKKVDSSANLVTVDAYSDETIDGEETLVLSLQYQYIVIICDGTEWHILGGEYVKIVDKIQQLIEEQVATKDILKAAAGTIERYLSEITDLELEEESNDRD